MYPTFDHWAHWSHMLPVLSMCSQCAQWVFGPLSPVYVVSPYPLSIYFPCTRQEYNRELSPPSSLALILSPAGVWSDPLVLRFCPESHSCSLDSGSQAPSHCTTGPILEPTILDVSQWLAWEHNEHITALKPVVFCVVPWSNLRTLEHVTIQKWSQYLLITFFGKFKKY